MNAKSKFSPARNSAAVFAKILQGVSFWMNRALGAPVCGPEYAFGKKPNEFLKSCKSLLPLTGALAVADGEGLNGVWLAERGVHVLAVDFSPSAQRKARSLAKERLVDVTFSG